MSEIVEIRDTRRTNREYYESNLKQLKTSFPGRYIIIIGGKVQYTSTTYAGWEHAWEWLGRDEQSEAYSIYIPDRNETFCGLIGT
jgi:hypothetical protein